MKVFLAAILLSSFSTFAEVNYDKVETVYDVSLKSGKEKSKRLYNGFLSKTLPYSITTVKKSITNFTDKCNNSLKDKRSFSEQTDCAYHDEQIIESFVVSDAKTGHDDFLVGRRLYNRGTFEHYELVTVKEYTNSHNQKIVNVTMRMIDDNEVNTYTTPKFKKDSSYDSSVTTFVLTEVSPEETHLSYEYKAETNHWLLNKEIMVPSVFVQLSRSMNGMVASLELESASQKRSLASK